MKRCILVVAWFAILGAAGAMAAPADSTSRGQTWSVLSGKTVGAREAAIHLQGGWPGISATVLYGVASNFDLGGRFTFNYDEEGIVSRVHPEVKVQGIARLTLLDRGRFNLGLTFAPGPLFYFPPSGTVVGLALPVALAFGFPTSSPATIVIALEMPLFVTFGTAGGLTVPMLFGAGFEFLLSRNVALTFLVAMGAAVESREYRSSAYFDLESLLGLAFRL